MPNPSPPPSLEDQEESVRIAVRALGDMRNGPPRAETSRNPQSLSIPAYGSSSASPESPTATRADAQQLDPAPPASPALFTRLSSFPMVGSALRVYEHGKASSRVVKYGAGLVESSVKTLSRPVINRLPVNVDQLDEFACRQLDRLEAYRNTTTDETSTPIVATSAASERGRRNSRASNGPSLETDSEMDRASSQALTHRRDMSNSSVRLRKGWKEGGERGVPSWLESTTSYTTASSIAPSRAESPTRRKIDAPPHGADESSAANDQQIAQRSRWHAVLLEAGGLSAALSEDSMRRLKYVLQWLQYATAHIDAQILIIREFTASLQSNPPDAPAHARRPNQISEEHMQKLAAVRKDVVQTVRQVVDVVSKYAGGALPEPARATVRGFIIKLPQRWASKTGMPIDRSSSLNPLGASERETVAAAGSGTGASTRRGGQRRAAQRERGAGTSGDVGEHVRSTHSSRAASPSSPRMPRISINTSIAQVQQQQQQQSENGLTVPSGGVQVSHGTAMVAAQRILSLATESLDMMRGVTGVVKDSLDRADMWVSRLRAVGLQRNGEPAEEGDDEGEASAVDDFDPLRPPRHYSHRRYQHNRHSRNSSSQFSEPVSPFFSSASTAAWSSSIPSTPGGSGAPGTYTPYGGYSTGLSSPGMVTLPPIGQMSLHSRCNTPKSAVGELPEEDEGASEDDKQRQERRMSTSMPGVQASSGREMGDESMYGSLSKREAGTGFEKSSERSTAPRDGVKVAGVDDQYGVGRMEVDGP